ncbi:NAD(P)/FAD-dependent oxidoreductase [Microbacterium sp. 3J1]|uniref:NAD(P)/FAD-dependent oxidoreductase n=1 Tax=Microbacterium sp. 3J1 TaxID=861269 RepID=UPI000A7210C4|nr:FAD-dependent oxidoreductase [Microbacterium sp. 3J1]
MSDDPHFVDSTRSGGTSRTLRMYGRRDSRDAYALRDYLTRSVVSYEWTEIETDLACYALTGQSLHDAALPIVDLPNGSRLVQPTPAEVAARLGWVMRPQHREYDLSIYGAGPAGLSAAVYAASEGLKVVLLEREAVGGQAGYSSLIENYLGFPDGIRGSDLAERARQQAIAFGAELLLMRGGTHGEFQGDRMIATLNDGTTMISHSNICATGVEWRRLGVAREDELLGLGVFYGAGTSEAAHCSGEDVIVVGGGNSAGQAVLNLSAQARSVTMVVRGADLSATLSSYLVSRIKNRTNVRLALNSSVTELLGDASLESVATIDSHTGERGLLKARKLFVCIGGAPNTDWARDTSIERDHLGYLVTGPDLSRAHLRDHWPLERAPFYLETSVPGSFAAGDVRRNSVKRVASGVGEGAMAVAFVHRFLSEHFV